MPEVLRIQNLTKRYGRGEAVIDGFSHTFGPATATALVGPNGSGKSTLIRLLTALSFPTKGSVRYGSLDVHKSPAAYLRKVGFVDDSGALPEYLTAVELLEWIARSRATFPALGKEGIDSLLDSVNLDERRHNLVGTYSSGMVKKAAIAAALVGQPDVLILDEPFRGLDVDTREVVENLFRSFAEEGGLLIMASHFGEAVGRICDQVLTLPLR